VPLGGVAEFAAFGGRFDSVGGADGENSRLGGPGLAVAITDDMKRLVTWLFVGLVGAALVLGACSKTPPSASVNPPADKCATLLKSVGVALGAVNTCSSDNDCTQGNIPLITLNNRCGGLTYNKSADLSTLRSMVSLYNGTCPETTPLVCAAACQVIHCTSEGRCEGGC
jgi:hypothetical protein